MRIQLEGIAFYLHNVSIQYSIHLNFINISNRKANLTADRKLVEKCEVSDQHLEITVNRRWTDGNRCIPLYKTYSSCADYETSHQKRDEFNSW